MLKEEFDRIYSEYRSLRLRKGSFTAHKHILMAFDGHMAHLVVTTYEARQIIDPLTIPLRDRQHIRQYYIKKVERIIHRWDGEALHRFLSQPASTRRWAANILAEVIERGIINPMDVSLCVNNAFLRMNEQFEQIEREKRSCTRRIVALEAGVEGYTQDIRDGLLVWNLPDEPEAEAAEIVS